jgi:hypothetical protein
MWRNALSGVSTWKVLRFLQYSLTRDNTTHFGVVFAYVWLDVSHHSVAMRDRVGLADNFCERRYPDQPDVEPPVLFWRLAECTKI